MAFEAHDTSALVAGGGDVVFCIIILCLSALSMIIFAATAGGCENGKQRRAAGRANGPVFVGGRGCACGGCLAGVGVCGTYLS